MPACGLPSALSAQPDSIAISTNFPLCLFWYSALGVESLAT